MHGVSTCSFQVGDISNLERELKIDQMQATEKQNLGMFSQSELDLFMVIILIHTLSCMAWFTQTSMNEWMFLYLWDMMGQVLNQSQSNNLTTHHNFFFILMDTSWLPKACASCLKGTTLRNAHSFLFQFHDCDTFPYLSLCLCECSDCVFSHLL